MPSDPTGAESPERAREILERRAELLARGTVAERRAEDREALVSFELGEQRFALEAKRVLEVAQVASWAPLPGAEPPLLGVTGWRGGLLTLYTLNRLLQLAAADSGGEWVVVLESSSHPLGLVVDRPGDFLEVDRSDLRSLPADRAGPGLVRAVTPDGVAVLDGAALLSLLS